MTQQSLQILRPVTVTESMLSSYNVAASDAGPAVYAGGTTYGLSALAYVQATQTIYQSQQAANTGHDPATDYNMLWWRPWGAAGIVALPDIYAGAATYAKDARVYVVSSALVYTSVQAANTGHDPVADTTHTWWAIAGAITGAAFDPPAYAGATVYAADARVLVSANNSIYASVQDGNVGHDPTLDLSNTWWVLVGSNNRHRMFDLRNSSATSRAGGIDVTITPGQVCNGIVLLNVAPTTSVRVTMTDPVAGVVYDKTTPMQAAPSAAAAFEYCFDPITYADTLIAIDMPLYRKASTRVQVITANAAAIASVGVLAIGLAKELGIGVKLGAAVGIRDYSTKEKNKYGDFMVVERDFSKLAKFSVVLKRNQVDAAQTLLASFRGIPCVYIGTDYYTSTVVFGYYEEFAISIDYYDLSILNINLEGLT